MNSLYRKTITAQDWAIVGAILGLLILLVLGFFFVVHANLQKEQARLAGELAKKQEDLREAREKAENLDQLEAEMTETQDLVADFEERLPNESELRRFVTSFETMARDLDVRVEVATQPRLDQGNKITHPFSVKAFGGYHNITGFINELERYKRYLKVTELEMGEMQAGIIDAEFTLNAYQFVESTTPAAAGESS